MPRWPLNEPDPPPPLWIPMCAVALVVLAWLAISVAQSLNQ